MNDAVTARVYIDGKQRPLFAQDPIQNLRLQLEDKERGALTFTNEHGGVSVIPRERVQDVVEEKPETPPMDINGALWGKRVTIRGMKPDEDLLDVEYDEMNIVVEAEDLGGITVLVLSPDGKEILYQNPAEMPEGVKRFHRAAVLAAEAVKIDTDAHSEGADNGKAVRHLKSGESGSVKQACDVAGFAFVERYLAGAGFGGTVTVELTGGDMGEIVGYEDPKGDIDHGGVFRVDVPVAGSNPVEQRVTVDQIDKVLSWNDEPGQLARDTASTTTA